MEKNKVIKSVDNDGKEVSVMLKTPTSQDYRDSQIEYNKTFRQALDSGAPLRQKLSDYMVEQDIWNDVKQKKHDEYIDKIGYLEEVLIKGGIKLSEARDKALELRKLRVEFRNLIAEKNALDQNSAEGQADNARFAELVRLCMLNPGTRQPYFQTQDDYDESATQPWVIEASSELASILYGLDPDYDNKLQENKFLKEFNFVNDDLDLVDGDGHLVDEDGRLINEEGRFIAYRTEEAKKDKDEAKMYFCNREGEEVVKITDEDGSENWIVSSLAERKPFFDDDGNPIITATKEAEAKEEDLVTEKKTAKPRTKKVEKAEKDS